MPKITRRALTAACSRHAHEGTEVAGSLVVSQITQGVGDFTLDQRKVGFEPGLHHVSAPLKLALALQRAAQR